MEEMINAYSIPAGQPQGKILLGRPRRGCKNNIRMDIREISWEHVV
jgi:hypothetical protein